MLSGSGYATEVEIKMSVADLKRDAQKRHGHQSPLIKRLYFAVPAYLFMRCYDYIPAEAGIIAASNGYTVVCREARPRADARPFTPDERYQLARLGTMRIWTLKEVIRCQILEKEQEHEKAV